MVNVAREEAEVIIDVLEAKINKYFKTVNHIAIADLYHNDCVIIDKQSGVAMYGKEGVKTTNESIAKGKPMQWKTFNRKLDLASSHIIFYGDCELFVEAESKTYKGTFKQILQKFGYDWLLIYEIFDLV